MIWEPPGLWASVIISILGGMAAGVLVLIGEILYRLRRDRRERRKAEGAIGIFFREWETAINNVPVDPDRPDYFSYGKDYQQAGIHYDFLRRAPNLIARWSRDLTAAQVEELINLLKRHESDINFQLREIGEWGQYLYDPLFCRAREIKWLDF